MPTPGDRQQRRSPGVAQRARAPRRGGSRVKPSGAIIGTIALALSSVFAGNAVAASGTHLQQAASRTIRTGDGIQFAIATAGGQVLFRQGSVRKGARFLGWSSTGAFFAYVRGFNTQGPGTVEIAARDGSRRVVVMRLAPYAWSPIMAWSPDDQLVAVGRTASRQVVIVRPQDGAPAPGLQVLTGRPLGWSAGNREVVVLDDCSSDGTACDLLARDPASGASRVVARAVREALVSPDGLRVAWTPWSESDEDRTLVISDLMSGGELSRTLGMTPVDWVATGQLVVWYRDLQWLWSPGSPVTSVALAGRNVSVARSGTSAVRTSVISWSRPGVSPRRRIRVVTLGLPGLRVVHRIVWQPDGGNTPSVSPSPDGTLLALWTDIFE